MFTCRRVAVFVILALAFSILPAPSGARGPVALAADRAETPEFKKDSAAKSFESGLKSFKNRDYRGARTDFKKARSSGKEKQDKAIVSRWIKATRGGEELTRVRRLVMAGRHREAYDHFTAVYVRYLGTPIASAYEKEWKKLGSRVATLVEGFDSHSSYYVRKPGRTFVEGEGKIFRGSHCLGWKSSPDKKTRAFTLRRVVPEDWSEYDTVELWYNARVAPRDMRLVLTCGRRGEVEDAGDHKLTARIRMKGKGWQRLRLPLGVFTSIGRPVLSKIKSVELSIRDDHRYDFMLDSISFLRNSREVAKK